MTWRRRSARRLAAEENGAVATEFLFIATPLLLLTMALLDFGWLTALSVEAEKSAQLGARIAVVSDPVAPGLAEFSGIEGGASIAGDSCMANDGSIAAFCDFGTIRCSLSDGCQRIASGPADIDPGDLDQATFDRIYNEMQRVYGGLEPEDVVIDYRASALGFAGRPGNAPDTYNLAPIVTVYVRNVDYAFAALGALFGFDPIQLPIASATLTGEDLNHTEDLL